MRTMKAIRQHEYGSASVLRYEDVPAPTPGPDEVLVKVLAVGLNPVDWKTRAGGGISRMLTDALPMIPGWDVSGVVEAIGADVTAFQPCDEVFGMVRFPQVGSAYAQYVTAPESHLALKPANVDHVQAAAIPLVALTAWQGLIEHADLKAGERVLVTGGTGGVGHVAVQIARAKGAYVIATSAPDGIDFVRALGADEVIDYTNGRFEDVAAPVDVVFDSVGEQTATRAAQALKSGGRFVGIAGKPDAAVAEAHQITVSSFLVRPEAGQLREIARLMAAGQLRSAIAEVFPLREAAQAHERGEQGHLRGKLVLEVEH